MQLPGFTPWIHIIKLKKQDRKFANVKSVRNIDNFITQLLWLSQKKVFCAWYWATLGQLLSHLDLKTWDSFLVKMNKFWGNTVKSQVFLVLKQISLWHVCTQLLKVCVEWELSSAHSYKTVLDPITHHTCLVFCLFDWTLRIVQWIFICFFITGIENSQITLMSDWLFVALENKECYNWTQTGETHWE